MSTRPWIVQPRRNTAAGAAENNKTPLMGERVYETDTKRWKTGDGATPYNDLPYDDEPVFAAALGVEYDEDGNVESVTEDGVTTTYTYNPDGTVDTDTRGLVTRQYTYVDGNLTGIEVI